VVPFIQHEIEGPIADVMVCKIQGAIKTSLVVTDDARILDTEKMFVKYPMRYSEDAYLQYALIRRANTMHVPLRSV
jgi:hypothetical protein